MIGGYKKWFSTKTQVTSFKKKFRRKYGYTPRTFIFPDKKKKKYMITYPTGLKTRR